MFLSSSKESMRGPLLTVWNPHFCWLKNWWYWSPRNNMLPCNRFPQSHGQVSSSPHLDNRHCFLLCSQHLVSTFPTTCADQQSESYFIIPNKLHYPLSKTHLRFPTAFRMESNLFITNSNAFQSLAPAYFFSPALSSLLLSPQQSHTNLLSVSWPLAWRPFASVIFSDGELFFHWFLWPAPSLSGLWLNAISAKQYSESSI